MADEKTKPALSLNQLHKRFLVDLSASQSRPKPVNFVSTMVNNNDMPKFNFGTPPPSAQEAKVEEPVSKIKDASPQLFDGLDDFDSPRTDPVLADRYVLVNSEEAEESMSKIKDSSPQLSDGLDDFDSPPTDLAEDLNEDGKTTKEDGIDSEINPDILESCEQDPVYPGTEISEDQRQTKVRLEGRRRLCKISYKNDGDVGMGVSSVREEEPMMDAITDFDSPPQVTKGCEDSASEIRDVLNDLTSRLEILSIEKRSIPKPRTFREDVRDPVSSKLYDVDTEEEFNDQKFNASSLRSSDLPADPVNGSKSRVTEVRTHSHISKANRTMYHHTTSSKNEPMKARPKPGFAKESPAYSFLTGVQDTDANRYTSLGETHVVKSVGWGQQQKLIEVSDDESEGVTALDHGDDFSLTGPKGTYKLSAKIASMLFPHQREGLKWLWSLHCKGKGGILGDDMGLGKTMQICGFLAGLFSSKLVRRVLVVAPKTLLTHWTNELSTVGLSRLTREYFSTCTKLRHYELQYVLQDKGILLTTYDIVRNNAKSLCGDYRYQDDGEDEDLWDYMILDEGHLIKNPSTQRAKSLLQIPCRHRVIISGTPLQNNLKELWALFSFCCPELLGDKNEFKEKYEYFINRRNEKNASDREKRIGSSVAKDLRDCIQPYFLRRLKSEVFGDNTLLSKKNELIVWLPLTRCQRELYEAFLKSEIVLSACDGSPLAAITILKKICDHPLLLTKRAAEEVLEGMDSTVNQEDQRVAEKLAMHIADVAERFDIVENNDISCKLSFISSLLGDLIPKGHNVLIFSQTRKMLDLIQESLVARHYRFMRIDGTTKAIDRAKTVKDFQDGGAPIFLLTSQVGGLGLTLTNADRVIVVDPAWNPSTDNQSVDRAYRIGQKKDVIVYRLMTCSTVEEKIYRKQVFKGGLFRSATEHKEQTRYFSQEDLRNLFSLPKQGFNISLTQQQLLEEHDRQHTMEESLRAHVEFLETLNIAGVSHHSLLFSKTAPVQSLELDEEHERLRGKTSVRNAQMHRSVEREVDAAEYAFNPKDAKKNQKIMHNDDEEPTEDEIREKINRFSHTYMNKAAVLPDKGLKLQKQIAALNQQLDQLRLAKGKEVIDLE